MENLKFYFKSNNNVLKFIKFNEERFNNILENSYNCFVVENWQITLIAKKDSNITNDVYIDISKEYAFKQFEKITK